VAGAAEVGEGTARAGESGMASGLMMNYLPLIEVAASNEPVHSIVVQSENEMGNDEYEILDDEEYETLTQHQKEAHIRDLIARKSMAIKKLNDLVKSLTKKGHDTKLVIHDQDDTKTQVEVFSDKKVQGFPQTKSGSKYQQVLDVTNIQTGESNDN